ncbi:preprotein translocase subunit SecE [Avibacterium paragallinarum]|uniref:Protein translocase subunit SecE n=1 Tax=Avibacterium paragallinarum TaxID=728 RepID=A0A0F5EUZ0_AVIPA|nr:preprotein translocase subunit SecE [Avibacterium paragallinarum]AZI15052.1 preprotein translocase subunit SecE [Avibacterium paragallinarum]KAA6208589.1 preprotein translocase subunit SecE [Avibacterium paragallinarum]KKB02516.1 preprotein translocase subunit SecE [Avibacterium paragallinarum]MEE3608483.1 preprotein translocase subunit SecE [Avibacterium paragallinarum]MEE3620571.1 preprotein translocase subunit SecE [Avibacterium paragallinarum]
MALDIHKHKHAQGAESNQKSKGLNTFLWLLAICIIVISAVGNIYFANQFSTPIRVVGIVILLLITLVILAITNQGVKARLFLRDSYTELRKIVWPTRQEAMQTTLIVVTVTVIVSLILWGLDSIIVSVINFLTNLRF